MTDLQTTTTTRNWERIVVVMPVFRFWQGARVMKSNDFKCDASDLPPEKAVKNLGAKYLIDRVKLNPFEAKRKAAYALLNEIGVKFMGGWAIPEASYASCAVKLEQLENEFNADKAAFIGNYDRYVEEWAQANPDFATEIRSGKIPVGDIAEKISASHFESKLATVPGKEKELEKTVSGLIDPILEDAGEVAKKALETVFSNQKAKTACLATKIGKLLNKLDRLSVVNGNLIPLVSALSANQLPSSGPLFGIDLSRAITILTILSSREKIQEVIDGKADPEQMAAALTWGAPQKATSDSGQLDLVSEPKAEIEPPAAPVVAPIPEPEPAPVVPDMWW